MINNSLTPKEVKYRDKLLGFVHLLVTDMDSAAKLMADGFVWENYLPEHVPFGGRYEGLEGMKRYIGQLGEHWIIGEIDFFEIVVSEDERKFVAIGMEKEAKAVGTGKSCDMATVWVAKLNESGAFTYVREYNDTDAMGQAWLP